MVAAASGNSCEMVERSGRICDAAPECCEAFYTCCNSTQTIPGKSHVLLSIANESNRTFFALPGAQTTTTQAPDTSEDVEPVHKEGGICARFSSALCEHYCHDAPARDNKFRCSCRRGYELAPNLRNCVESGMQQQM